MSVALITAAFNTKLPPTQKFVFVALCDNASNEGVCFPLIKTICEKTSLKERAVQGAIKFLIENGYMNVKRRQGHSNIYQITPASEWPKELSTEEDTPHEMHPAPDAPPHNMHPTPHNMHPTPAPDAPTPALNAPTPALNAPITVTKPSINHQGNHHSNRSVREAQKRKTRLPDDWFLPKDWGDWAVNEGYNEPEIREQAELFADHWRSKGEARLDWLATWRNWMRRSRSYTPSKSYPQAKSYPQKTSCIEHNLSIVDSVVRRLQEQNHD